MQGFFRVFFRNRVRFVAVGSLVLCASLWAQDGKHGRKYKPPPPTTHIVVTVEKGFNSKPIPNAAVIFYSTKDGKDNGNLELKTDPEGRAILDLIETGSHVRVQVIANGFATHAEEFDVPGDEKELLVKMRRPQAQVSTYVDNDGKAAEVKPGVQEHPKPKPAIPPAAPVTTTPTPSTQTPAGHPQ